MHKASREQGSPNNWSASNASGSQVAKISPSRRTLALEATSDPQVSTNALVYQVGHSVNMGALCSASSRFSTVHRVVFAYPYASQPPAICLPLVFSFGPPFMNRLLYPIYRLQHLLLVLVANFEMLSLSPNRSYTVKHRFGCCKLLR
jgi:hypothetical protein